MVLLDSTKNYHLNAFILRNGQDITLSFIPIPSGVYTVIVYEVSENNRSCNHSFETVVSLTIPSELPSIGNELYISDTRPTGIVTQNNELFFAMILCFT